MADFPAMKLTTAGQLLMAKVQTGEQLGFTRIKLGEGLAPVGTPTDIVSLQSEIVIGSNPVLDAGFARIDVNIIADTVEGFWLREVWSYALDPDVGEIAYAYSFAKVADVWVPSIGVAFQLPLSLFNRIDNAENVVAVIGGEAGGGIKVIPIGQDFPVVQRRENWGYLFVTDTRPDVYFINSNLTGRLIVPIEEG